MVDVLIIPSENPQYANQIKWTLEFQGKTVAIGANGNTEAFVKATISEDGDVRIEGGDHLVQSTFRDAPKNIYDVLKLVKK